MTRAAESCDTTVSTSYLTSTTTTPSISCLHIFSEPDIVFRSRTNVTSRLCQFVDIGVKEQGVTHIIDGRLVQVQDGVWRVNCLDCLVRKVFHCLLFLKFNSYSCYDLQDRTNVAQFCIVKSALPDMVGIHIVPHRHK